MGVDLPAYDLYLDFRHGTYIVEDEEISVSAIITYIKSAYDEDGTNGLAQSYSVEAQCCDRTALSARASVWAGRSVMSLNLIQQYH